MIVFFEKIFYLHTLGGPGRFLGGRVWLISHNSKTTAPRKIIFTSIDSETQVSYLCSIHYMALTALFLELFSKNCFTPFCLPFHFKLKLLSLHRTDDQLVDAPDLKPAWSEKFLSDFWVNTTLTQVTSDSAIASTSTLHCMAGCKAWKWLLLLIPYHFKSYYCKSSKDVIFYSAVCKVAQDKFNYCTNFHSWLLFSLY